MSAIERAKHDLERGDHWLARMRLRSFMVSKGYDPVLLAELGLISNEMHDDFDAGRMWLTSTAVGDRVDQAIETFISHCHRDAPNVVAQFPHTVRLASADGYPPVVQERLRRLGLDSAIVRLEQSRDPSPPRKRWVEWVFVIAVLLVSIFAITSCVVGARQITSWFFHE